MDAVIAYVNEMEPIWRSSFIRTIGFSHRDNDNKFRDYGTLRFVLRGISEHMKFIDRVFLVVSNIEQVPDYVNDNVIIITHDMFIPEEHLPTFNALTIECFLWNIPDLSEEFIYFNDDMIPIGNMNKEDFFKDGLPCLNFRVKQTTSDMFNSIINLDNRYAHLFSEKENCVEYLWTDHIITPFLKTEYFNSFDKFKNDITTRITPLRRESQFSQHYFSVSLYYQKKYIQHTLDYFYIGTNITDKDLFEILSKIKNEKILCLNDYGLLKGKTFSETISIINFALNNLLNTKGIYEK